MKKGQRRLLLVLLSALMVFFVCGLTAYADDQVVGLRTTEGTIYISNDTASTIKVTGVKSDGSGWYFNHESGLMNEPYTTPSVLTNIYSNEMIKFEAFTPKYEVSKSTDEDYKYCFKFTDTKAYKGNVNLTVQHAHEWSLKETDDKTVEIECLNKGCEWYSKPVTLTLEAKDARYDANGYDVKNVTITPNEGGKIPEDVKESFVFRHLGKKVANPMERGLYTVSAALELGDEKVTLTDSFMIKRGINARSPLFLDPAIINDWNVGEKPNKPDLDWTVAKNPLVIYSDVESINKIIDLTQKLMNKDETISIKDFEALKGVKVSLIPPTKEGSYLIFVVGVSKHYYDAGFDAFNVGERRFDAKIGDWTYGEYDAEKDAPEAYLYGEKTDEAAFYYKPLFSCEDEEDAYAVFDPEKANDIDAGLYIMRVELIDEAEVLETYKVFNVSKAFTEVTAPVARELVANGSSQELVTVVPNPDGKFFYSVNQIGEPDDESILGSFDIPTGTDAGTYIVRYRFIPDRNHYSGVEKGRIKVVIKPAAKPDSGITPPPGAGDDQSGNITPSPSESNEKLDGKLPNITARKPAVGKTSVVAKWKRLSKKSSKRCEGIEIMVATDKAFTKDCVTKKASSRAASCKISGLARKTTYYVKVRTFRDESKVKYVGKWSKVKKIRTR